MNFQTSKFHPYSKNFKPKNKNNPRPNKQTKKITKKKTIHLPALITADPQKCETVATAKLVDHIRRQTRQKKKARAYQKRKRTAASATITANLLQAKKGAGWRHTRPPLYTHTAGGEEPRAVGGGPGGSPAPARPRLVGRSGRAGGGPLTR